MLTIISSSGDDIEAAAIQAYQLGTDAEQPDAMFWLANQLLWAREAQGRLGEVVDLMREQVAVSESATSAMQAVMAVVLARCGQAAEARGLIDQLLEGSTDPIPRDASWLMAHTNLGLAIHAAGTADQACREYEYLLPYAGRLTAVAMAIGFSVDFALAVLAVRAGWPERAEEHFADAHAQDVRLGAAVWLARTNLEWGRFLLDEGETERAQDHLTQAREGAERMGAIHIAEEAGSLLST